LLAAVAEATETIRIAPYVAQIPMRNPAMLARESLTVEQISNGRLEIGLGIGLPIDPSYEMMGIPNWTNAERVERFPEYIELVDALLRNEITTYTGKFYSVKGAHMNPRPVQQPRPPITIAALGPKMLSIAARYADTWNTMSFATTSSEQLTETRDRVSRVRLCCERIGRDPDTLRLSYNMFDPGSRASGGLISYLESEQRFVDTIGPYLDLGFREFGLYYPMLPAQRPTFERIATEVFPDLREQYPDS
jgi:alkanesulfonate monooxygenase SsuD/methylene tetrahydromethanopterin reductase-like flavin-dependent oxidoreductase (luciferase family)